MRRLLKLDSANRGVYFCKFYLNVKGTAKGQRDAKFD